MFCQVFIWQITDWTVGRSLYKKFNSAISYITQEEGDGGAEKTFFALLLFYIIIMVY